MINWSVKIQDDLIINKLRPPCLVTLPPKNHSLKLTQKNLSFGDFQDAHDERLHDELQGSLNQNAMSGTVTHPNAGVTGENCLPFLPLIQTSVGEVRVVNYYNLPI